MPVCLKENVSDSGNVYKVRGGKVVNRRVNRGGMSSSDSEGGGCLGCAFVIAAAFTVMGALSVFFS